MSSDSEYTPPPSPKIKKTEVPERDRYRYKVRRCLYCGKPFGKNWKMHWKTQHPGVAIRELPEGHMPIGVDYLEERGIFPKNRIPPPTIKVTPELLASYPKNVNPPNYFRENFSSLFGYETDYKRAKKTNLIGSSAMRYPTHIESGSDDSLSFESPLPDRTLNKSLECEAIEFLQ